MGYKVTRIMALILFLIMMTATIPLGYAIEWSPDMRLTWNSAIDASPSIAQANDGKIWVVWHSYRTGNADLFYKVYNSSQVHPWSSEKNLTANPNVDKSPAIMQAQDDKIWVVWSTNRTGNYEIYYKNSSDNGATWPWPEKNLTANPKDDDCPSIMQVANGTIWFAWSANRTGNFDIYYKTSQDNGATWSTDKFLNYPTTNDTNPSITQATDGKIWFVWERDKNKTLNIWYKYYYYGYSEILNRWMWMWGATRQVTLNTDSEVLIKNPSVTGANDGKIWIVWDSDERDKVQTDIYYYIYYPDGTTFQSSTPLTDNGADDITSSIMQAANGAIWIAWASWRTGRCDIYYKTTEIPPLHDVSIFSVIPSKAAVFQGQTVSIEVVAQNHGMNNENFIVRCYAGSTLINETTMWVAPGQLYVHTCTWNTPNTGTYTISANASTVPYETNTADNTFIDATVHVKIPGDVNDDQTVNDLDLSALSNAHGSKPGDLNWNPNCDFNGDNKVDAFDLFDLGKNYGKSQ